MGGGEDALEGGHAAAVGGLNPPQVVPIGDTAGVQRVLAVAVAMPEVDGMAAEQLAGISGVRHREVDCQRDTGGGAAHEGEGSPSPEGSGEEAAGAGCGLDLFELWNDRRITCQVAGSSSVGAVGCGWA